MQSVHSIYIFWSCATPICDATDVLYIDFELIITLQVYILLPLDTHVCLIASAPLLFPAVQKWGL